MNKLILALLVVMMVGQAVCASESEEQHDYILRIPPPGIHRRRWHEETEPSEQHDYIRHLPPRRTLGIYRRRWHEETEPSGSEEQQHLPSNYPSVSR